LETYRFESCPDYKKINMRSKTFQRILDKMEKDTWWVKLKRWLLVEFYVIKCLGVVKYIKNKK
jgi:hypothetical protein